MNKVAVITGASRGIGEALAYEFSQKGFATVITYHGEESLAQAVRERCLELGASTAHAFKLDLTSNESIKSCAREILELFPTLDTLVNNAGILITGKLSEQSFEQIDEQLTASLVGPMKFTSLLLPAVKGLVINIGSNLATTGKKNLVGYCAAKFGIRGMTQALAKEWPDIKILALHPGLTATSMGGQGGANPLEVARVIFRFATAGHGAQSGSAVWIQDYLPGFWRSPRRILRRLRNIFK